MANAPSTIKDPSLHVQWSKAKKAAKQAAADLDKKNKDKTKKQAKAFDLLAKKKYKEDLGPNLDKWVKLYPNHKKMETLHLKSINASLLNYIKGTKDSTLHDGIKKPLVKTLKDINTEQGKRADTAKALIDSDVDMAIKESKKKIPPPIVVFKHPDIMRPVLAKTGALKNIQVQSTLFFEVIIDDKKILAMFPTDKDYLNESGKIRDAGNFSKVVADLAKVLKLVDANVGNGKPLAKQEELFLKFVDKAIEDCRKRAMKEAGKQGHLPSAVKWATLKRGGKLVLTAASGVSSAVGVTVAGVGVATATFGAGSIVAITSIVVSCIGLAKTAVDLGKQIADIASTAEMMANGITKDLNFISKSYSKWLKKDGVSHALGAGELVGRAINTVIGDVVPTLKRVSDDVDTFDEKIDSIELRANKLAGKISEYLTNQEKANKEYKKIMKLGRDALSKDEFDMLLACLKIIDKTAKSVNSTIESVIKMNKRVKTNRTKFKALDKQLKKITLKKPLWSEISSALVDVSSGLLVGAALGVADLATGGGVKTVVDIAEFIRSTATDIVDNAEALKSYNEDLKKAFDTDLKRARAKKT